MNLGSDLSSITYQFMRTPVSLRFLVGGVGTHAWPLAAARPTLSVAPAVCICTSVWGFALSTESDLLSVSVIATCQEFPDILILSPAC